MSRIKKAETRKQDILQAAFECFAQFGYSKTSFDLIAQKIGISRPLIYQHFKDKEHLFASMMEDRFNERYVLAEQSLSSNLTKKEKLLKMVEIIILKDWSIISNSFNGIEFFSELISVLPKFEEKYRKRFIQMAASVLENKELAEVFRFSLTGLTSDNPSMETLRKRVKILVECVSQ
jgi:AcrR family transcriptional regulator